MCMFNQIFIQKTRFIRFFSQVKVGGKGSSSTAHRNKQQQQQTPEGYTLEYKVKRRIPLESISEIKLR